MKEPFWWDNSPNKPQVIQIYCLEQFIDLCHVNESKALEYLKGMWIEYWLYKNNENVLGKEVKKIRNDSNILDHHKINHLIQKFNSHLNNSKFFKLLDIDKAIEITLKEYETLRTEILQNISEISQLILLGLAAIFTIASIGLAPLADFLTVEDTTIEMPLSLKDIGKIIKVENPPITINNGDFRISNDEKKESVEIETSPIKLREFVENIVKNIDPEMDNKTTQQIIDDIVEKNDELSSLNIDTAMVIVRDTSKETKYYLKITRATNGKTIEDRGIVPSIVIFNWLIPGLSLYLIYRSLFAIKKSRMIGKYIYHRIEQKLVNLSFLKKQYLGIEDNYINFINNNETNYFTTRGSQTINYLQDNLPEPKGRVDRQNGANFKEHLTHISWQHYIKNEGKKYSDPLDANLIYVFFALISAVSFVGGSALLVFNFELDKWPWDDFWKGILTNNHNGGWSISVFLLVIFILLLSYYCWLNKKDICHLFSRWSIAFVTALYIGVFTGILPAFYGIPSQKLDHTQLLFLLVLPLLIYTFFIMFCLTTKDEVEKLIDPSTKDQFRRDSTDPIVHKMWN